MTCHFLPLKLSHFILVTTLVLTSIADAQQSGRPPFQHYYVQGNVHMFEPANTNGNPGALVGDDGILLIDSHFDFSVEDQNIDLENYDVLGIYAPMHTATILSIEYIKDKKLPNKMFTFGLYGSVLEDFNSSIRYIKDIESDELSLFLEINDDHQFSLKNNIPNRQIFPDISNYAHLVDGSNNLIAGSVETTYGCKHSCTHCPVPISCIISFLKKFYPLIWIIMIFGSKYPTFKNFFLFLCII